MREISNFSVIIKQLKTQRLISDIEGAAHLSHSHGMYVSVGRLPLGHLYSCDSQRPDVSDTVVADLLYDFWRHPEWCADHRISLCHGVLYGVSGGVVFDQQNVCLAIYF